MSKLTRRLDIQTIRAERKMTQKELAHLTGFPQGFISKMESGKVSTSEAFIEKVKEVLEIQDIDKYVSFEPMPGAAEEPEEEVPQEMTDKMMIDRLFKLLEKREARIEKLELELDALRRENALLKK